MNVSDVLKLKFDAIGAFAQSVPAMVKDVLRNDRGRNTPLEYWPSGWRLNVNARQGLRRARDCVSDGLKPVCVHKVIATAKSV